MWTKAVNRTRNRQDHRAALLNGRNQRNSSRSRDMAVSPAQLSLGCRGDFVSLTLTVGLNDDWIFGSGTKLYVTERQVVRPVVSVYPAATRDGRENRLLCVASAMFPPEVRFSWKSPEQEPSSGPGQQLQLGVPGRSAAILVLGQHDVQTEYICSVKHEGGTVEAGTQQVILPRPRPPAVPPPPCSRLRLLCLQYTLLTVKTVVYCCGLSLMTVLRSRGLSSSSC